MQINRVVVQMFGPTETHPGQVEEGQYTYEDGMVTLVSHAGARLERPNNSASCGAVFRGFFIFSQSFDGPAPIGFSFPRVWSGIFPPNAHSDILGAVGSQTSPLKSS
jgi:hypothetical protein